MTDTEARQSREEEGPVRSESSTTASLVDRARQTGLGDILHRSAARWPGKLAVADQATTFTFAEFDVVVDRFAAAMSAEGLAKGDRLALMSHNCWQFAALAFATARIGVILVPINFMLTEGEVSFILDSCGAKGFLVEDELLAAVSNVVDSRIVVRGVIRLADHPTPEGWTDIDDWVRETSAPTPDVPVGDDDPIRLMYTSGTESRPKGVVLSSRSLIAEYASCLIDGGMAHNDVDLHALPLYHCAQLDAFFEPDIYMGATSIILRGPDPTAILDAISRHRVTKFFAPPTVWIAILRSPLFEASDLSSLRKGYYGASPMPTEILREIRDRLPNLELWNLYGQTELGPVATLLPPEDQADHAGSAGRPVLNIETRVVGSDDLPVPPGTVGEVVHRGPHITSGYWNDPEKTAAAFRSGWFHSGDLGVMSPEGRLTLVDRIKDMIKSGGENVASREIEEKLYEHPDVLEAAVFGTPDPKWVEKVTAAVILRDGAEADADALRRHCADGLAGYKMPKQIYIVDELPKNPSGKILKRELRATYTGQPLS